MFPIVGFVVEGIVGKVLDIPTFRNDYKLAKEEYLNILKSRPDNVLKKIVRDYNDAINYFGRRADLETNQRDYDIPIVEEEHHINIFGEDELLELMNIDE